jgi:putative SOS response-associated peptidase YedK
MTSALHHHFGIRAAKSATRPLGFVLSLGKGQQARQPMHQRQGRDAEQRPSFSEAFQQRRCIVPADGFYEWAGPKAKRRPLWIHPRAGGLLLFAGLYESWYPEKDRPELTFTIVTCAASATIAAIHDRMPVVLDERAAEDWMDPRERDPLSLKRLLVPAPHDLLAMRPASPLVNNVKNEGPALLEFSEAATPDLFGSTRRRSVTFRE